MQRKIELLLGATLAVSLCQGVATECVAQEPTIHFTTNDMAACDVTTLACPLELDNYSGGYTYIFVYYTIDDADQQISGWSARLSDVVKDGEYKWTQSIGDKRYDNERGYRDYTINIVSARFGDGALNENGPSIKVGYPSKLLWHVYGTPTTDAVLVAANDPSAIKITNKAENCGWDLQLKANSAWDNGVSKYEWWSSSDNFTFSGEAKGVGSTTWLNENRPSTENGVKVGFPQAMKTTITLRQTVGNMCWSETTKEITMLGMPRGTIASKDEAGNDKLIEMCSSVDVSEDPTRVFSGTLTLAGEQPFVATLSTGDRYEDLANGINYFDGATAQEAGSVVIAELTDSNGCVADETLLMGNINVRDRKPQPIFRNDTISSNSKDLRVEAEASQNSHDFEWGVLPESVKKRFDTKIVGNSYAAEVVSNMNGLIGYYVIETDNGGGEMVSCSSDTTKLYVDFSMPIRYPNAISPNGDGKNDCLVIEGLSEENRVMVVDGRGKVVFETENYRNDWNAEGLEDGYYVYVFKGTGTKTVKEQLVIKRK